jgi:uncharacterized protein (DUF2147 family)
MHSDMPMMVWRALLLGSVLCGLGQAAAAAEPWGQWLVADKTAEIRVADCGGALWGFVAWEADPGVDAKNPDPAKRTRPTLGVPIIIGMKPAASDRWTGALYNPENGKTYTGGVSLSSNDVLRVRGCVLGILCGGENWMRVKTARPGAPELSHAALCASLAEGR